MRSEFFSLWENIHIAFILGNQDIKSRYKRSKIGAFWVSINLLILISCLYFVFGYLLKSRMEVVLPMLATGLIAWTYISSLLVESASAFTSSSGLILQTNTPILCHLVRVWWRNTIIFFHNLLIVPFIYLLFDVNFSINFFQFIPACILFTFFMFGPCLFLSVISTRFRDFENLVQNLLQVLFYLTPIIWSLEMVDVSWIRTVVMLNPLYYPVILIQKTLISINIEWSFYLITIILSFINLFIGAYFFAKYRKRIPFWL